MSKQQSLVNVSQSYEAEYFDTANYLVNGRIVGELLFIPRKHIPLSRNFPAVSLTRISSYIDLTSTVAPDYHAIMRNEFIDIEGDSEVFYDQFGVDSVSGSDIILSNTTENNRLLADMYEDALVHGGGAETPSYTNWLPITGDNGIDYAITGINTGTRTITVSGSPAAFSYVKLSQYRVGGDTSKVRVYSMRGRTIVGAGGPEIASGLRRRDRMQRITGATGAKFLYGPTGPSSGALGNPDVESSNIEGSGSGNARRITLDSADSPDARTSPATDTEGATHGNDLGTGIYQWLGRYLG